MANFRKLTKRINPPVTVVVNLDQVRYLEPIVGTPPGTRVFFGQSDAIAVTESLEQIESAPKASIQT